MSAETTQGQDHWLGWLRPMLLPAVLALAVLIAGGVYLDRQTSVLNEERMRAAVLSEVAVIRAKLEGNINGNIQLVRGLVSTLSTEPDMNQQRFSDLTSTLFGGASQLRSVAAAPDLVVAMVYPPGENSRAIGLNYLTNDDQRDAVLRARDTGRLVLAGPVDLVQGGRGFIGRFPVYTDKNGEHEFWGVVSAVVDADRLYAESGLNNALNIDVSLTGRDATGSVGTRFYGKDLSALDPVMADVVLPSGTWQIAAVPKEGWVSAQRSNLTLRIVMIAAGALILLPILITARLIGERQSHFRELTAREAELEKLSRRLGLALETSQVGVWEMDIETRDLFWDERMNELYGLPTDGGTRDYTSWRDALHPDDLAAAQADFNLGIESGRYLSEFRTLHGDGSIRHVRSLGAVYMGSDGHRKILGVNWDVTADVERNEALRRATQLTEARNQQLEAVRVRIEHNALHDSLTGLPNRRYLDEMLKRHAEFGYQDSGSVALLHIDLDRFKQINDTLGHAAGDAMLIHAASVLRDNCDAGDFVARIGGDEFVVLTTAGAGDGQLGELADRIVQKMRQPVTFEGHLCRFGVSIGIAARAGTGIDVKRLLINADIALYRAKARGRNRFEFFSDALQAEVVTSKRLGDEILGGIERQEFVAWFQPQFDARTLDVVGVEALARWQHPTEGLKAPDSFLGIAEELNVVATLDRVMLEQSLAALRRWDGMGLTVPRVSVNVSLRRLNDEDLIPGLQELDIQAGRVSFELVESIYLDERDDIVGWNIDQIKDMGIDVEIDDFGTGYASIVSLQKLRPKRLKIDRQLVDPILTNPAQRQLLASIVEIGKSMGIEVVAEGVETMEHAAILRDLGCDILQGYALSRPLSGADLEAFLKTHASRQTDPLFKA